jgi:hypothetical protein
MALMTDLRALADTRFLAALERSGARDPREFYRERLRSLRESDPEAYRAAVDHFERHLIPTVAREGGDPLAAWLEYGRYLASLCTPGEAVQIDPSGRSEPYAPPVPLDRLVLHLPTSPREAALAVGLPPTLSPAQKLAYDLLVLRKVS